MEKRYYTIPEMCGLLGISEKTARALAERCNAIRHIGPRLIRVDMPALERALEEDAAGPVKQNEGHSRAGTAVISESSG